MERVRTLKWIPAFSALLLLALTAMPAIVRMHCLSSGRTVMSIGQAKGCCTEHGHDGKGAVVHSTCCELERTAPDHTVFTVDAAAPLWAVLPPRTAHEPVTSLHPGSGHAQYRLNSRPPPRLTPERLSFAGSYLL